MATTAVSQPLDFNQAYNNLKTFVDHNANSYDPSIYRLVVVNDNEIVSEQTCLFMRVIEMVCAYVVNFFKVLFCCCWCVDEAKESQQRLIKETLRQSLDLVNQAEIPQDRQDEFQRMQTAFNQIMGAVRDGRNDSCMNSLYERTGWNITSDLYRLTVANQQLMLAQQEQAETAITAQPTAASTDTPEEPSTSEAVVVSTAEATAASTSGVAAAGIDATATTVPEDAPTQIAPNAAGAPNEIPASDASNGIDTTALVAMIDDSLRAGTIDQEQSVIFKENVLEGHLTKDELLPFISPDATPEADSTSPGAAPNAPTDNIVNNAPTDTTSDVGVDSQAASVVPAQDTAASGSDQ